MNETTSVTSLAAATTVAPTGLLKRRGLNGVVARIDGYDFAHFGRLGEPFLALQLELARLELVALLDEIVHRLIAIDLDWLLRLRFVSEALKNFSVKLVHDV